ncbi:hypothetical protein OG232_04260 [Streptomyces sp. NBC_01411]|uniref:hypothetical protein n=1 Tax=Streptomyces sp. NBC_01411 TaxID=2903857 RepID=UPI00324BE5C0
MLRRALSKPVDRRREPYRLRLLAALEVLWATGVTQAELVAADVAHVAPDRSTIELTVNPPGRTEATVQEFALPESARAALGLWLPVRADVVAESLREGPEHPANKALFVTLRHTVGVYPDGSPRRVHARAPHHRERAGDQLLDVGAPPQPDERGAGLVGAHRPVRHLARAEHRQPPTGDGIKGITIRQPWEAWTLSGHRTIESRPRPGRAGSRTHTDRSSGMRSSPARRPHGARPRSNPTIPAAARAKFAEALDVSNDHCKDHTDSCENCGDEP